MAADSGTTGIRASDIDALDALCREPIDPPRSVGAACSDGLDRRFASAPLRDGTALLRAVVRNTGMRDAALNDRLDHLPHAPADRVLALEIARARLDTILEAGGRETAGAATAMAQVGFDCWMQEQEENFQLDDIANCMRMFEQGASAAEKALRPPSPSPSPSTPSSAPSPSSSRSSTPSSAPSPKPVDTGPWEIYFAWDSAAIGAAAQQEINRAYTSFGKLAGSVMHISGHADTSGPSGYNQKLSERRAHTVYEVFTLDLLAPEDRVTVRAVGEKELAVKTPDNTREVLNRRVVLRLTK